MRLANWRAVADLSAFKIRCPACGYDMWAVRAGQWTLKTAIIRVDDGVFIARCPEGRCKGEAVVPMVLLHSDATRRIVRIRKNSAEV